MPKTNVSYLRVEPGFFGMKLRLIFALALVVITSGCMSYQTDVHISKDAEIEKLESEIVFTSDGSAPYDQGSSQTDFFGQNLSEGENDLTEKFKEKDFQDFNFSDVEVEVISEENSTGLDVTYYDVELSENSSVELYKEDGEVVFKDPEYALANSAFPQDQANTGAGLGSSGFGSTDTGSDLETDYGPYCTGSQGFITEDVDISQIGVVEGELVLELRGYATEQINVKSLSIGGEEKKVDEDLAVGGDSEVKFEGLNPEEMSECQTYEAEITYMQDGEEKTASGEIEMEYGLDLTSQTAATAKESETQRIQSDLGTDSGGLDYGSSLDSQSSGLEGLESYEDTMLDMMNESIDIKYRVHMPGKIVETNGKEIEDNTVKYGFDAMAKEEKEPYVRSKASQGIVQSVTNWLGNLF
jgi:hypothetical protein